MSTQPAVQRIPPPVDTRTGSGAPVIKKDWQENVKGFFDIPNNVFYLLLAHGFLCNGLVLAALGPSLLSLTDQTGSTLSTIVYIFTARSLGHLCGTFLGGYVVDKWTFHQRASILVPVSGLALMTILIPSCFNLFTLIVVVGVQGLCSGWIDNACQVLTIRYKNEDKVNVSPYLQGLHFFFALGAVIAPFIFAGFMGNNALAQVNSDVGGDSTQQSYNMSDPSAAAAQTAAISISSRDDANGFYVIFCLILPGIIGLAYYVFWNPQTFEIDTADMRHCITLQPGGLARHEGHRGEKEVVHHEHNEEAHYSETAPQVQGQLIHPDANPFEDASYERKQPDLESGELPAHPPAAASEVLDGSPDEPAIGTEDVHAYAPASTAEAPVPASTTQPRPTLAQQSKAHGRALISDTPTHLTGIGGVIVNALPHLTPLGFVMILLVGLVLFFYLGMENYSNFIFTYGVSIIHWNAVTSAVVNSAFWIAFALGRLIAIPISHIWSPTKILLTCVSVSLFWMFLLIFGTQSGGFFAFITVVYGLSSAPIYPTVITWGEQYLKITGKILSAIIMFDCLGAATLPLLMAFALSNGGGLGDGFVLVMLLICISTAVCFGVLLIFVVPRMNGQQWMQSIQAQLKSQREQDAEGANAVSPPGQWHS